MSPSKSMRSPNPQQSWRWGLWEVIRLRWDRPCKRGIPAPRRNQRLTRKGGDPGETSLRLPILVPPPPPREGTARRRPSASPKESSPETKPCWTWTVDLAASRTVRKERSVVEATQSAVFCGGSLSLTEDKKKITELFTERGTLTRRLIASQRDLPLAKSG